MASPDFTIKTGDTSPFLQHTCLDYALQPVNLAGASVVFVMRRFTYPYDVIIQEPANNDDVDLVTTGYVSYEWAPGDTDEPGEYLGEWEVTFANAEVETFPNGSYINILILDDLGGTVS